MQQHSKSEEDKEHKKDKDKIEELIKKHSVDLIVVGANKLEARKIKETLKEIAENIKNYSGSSWKNEDDPRGSKNSRQGESQLDERKEAFVIWGSLEIPKLFSSSH
jgi:RNase H-fold protein (predicted Holliday junction resolvase)